MKNSTAKKLKQVPERYLIIGVDPHKKKHVAVVMTQDAILLQKAQNIEPVGTYLLLLGSP